MFKNTSGIGMPLDPVGDLSKLKAEKVSQPRAKFTKGKLAVPVTRLYDLGIMTRSSEILEPRLESCQIMVHPDDAEKLGLRDGDQAEVKFEDNGFRGKICLDVAVPLSVILVPKRMGVGLTSPENTEIKKLD